MRAVPKPPLMPSANVMVRHFGDASHSDVRVYIFLDVLDEIIFHAQYRSEPAATLLVGGYFEGPAGPYIEIQGFTEAMYAESARHYQGTLARTLPRIRERLHQEHRPQRILGWTMGRAGLDGRMDEEGVVLHNSFFNLAHQIHIAIDPESEEFCVYRRSEDGGPLISCGFNVVATTDSLAGIRAQWAQDQADEANKEVLSPPVEEDVKAAARTASPGADSSEGMRTPEEPLSASSERESGDEPEVESDSEARDTIDVGPPDGFEDSDKALDALSRIAAENLAALDASIPDEPELVEDDPTLDGGRPEPVGSMHRTTRPIQPELELGEPEPLETGLEVGGVHTRVTQEVPPLSSQEAAPAEGGDLLASVRESMAEERKNLFDVPSLEMPAKSMTAYGRPGAAEEDENASLGDVVPGSSRDSGRFQSLSLQKAKPYSLSATALAATGAHPQIKEAPIPGSETIRSREDIPDLEPELLDAADKLVINTLADGLTASDDFDTAALAAEIKANPDRALDAVERAVEELENVHEATRLSPGIGEFSGSGFDIDDGWFLDGDDVESAFDSVMSSGPKWVPFSSASVTNESSNRIDTKGPKSHTNLDLRSRFQRLRERRKQLKSETEATFEPSEEE